MVAKPELLLFLDEPSSGLDAQTSMSVLSLLETLKNHGQASESLRRPLPSFGAARLVLTPLPICVPPHLQVLCTSEISFPSLRLPVTGSC